MLKDLLILYLAIASMRASSAMSNRQEPIFLRLGEARNLPISAGETLRVGKRGIVRIVEDGRRIRIFGLKSGSTAIASKDRSYLVNVGPVSQQKFYSELATAMHSMRGLELHDDVFPIEVHGTLLRFQDWESIAQIARTHQGIYLFKAQALPDVGQLALQRFREILKKRGMPILRFSFSPRFSVHLPKTAPTLKSEAQEIFAPFGIAVVPSHSDLQVQPLVQTQVVIAEVNRSKGLNYGIEWPSSSAAQILPKLEPAKDLMVTLKALADEGHAQILASPTLLCRSGAEAQFHSGGEFPIRTAGRHHRDVTWKAHGVVLKVRPKADFQGSINLEIETEISLLDMANAVDGVPALKKNSVKSYFDLTGKRTIAISGLIRQEVGDSFEGLPGLSRLPILGALFSSRQFRAQQSELVIFLTPEIAMPETNAPIEMPGGWITREW